MRELITDGHSIMTDDDRTSTSSHVVGKRPDAATDMDILRIPLTWKPCIKQANCNFPGGMTCAFYTKA